MFAGTVALGLFLTLWPPTRELLESRRLPPESASLGVLMAMVVTAMLTVFAIVSGMPEAVAHAH
jgi:ABC-type phosphate transport system permease subunit